MASLLSPGVITREIDLTTVTPAVASTEGGIAMHAQWGPAQKLVLVTDELDLLDVFGKPNNANASDWFTAKNFLSYSGALFVSRALGRSGPDLLIDALNSTSNGSGVLIMNEEDYEEGAAALSGAVWAARYPGELGNSLKVSLADSSTFDDWAYKSLFSDKPEVDELHILVLDEDGLFSGVKETVLEKYEFLSKFADGKSEDGSSLYYKKVIDDRSEYVYALKAPANMSAWGENADSHVDYDLNGKASLKGSGSSLMMKYSPSASDPGTLETYSLTLKKQEVSIALSDLKYYDTENPPDPLPDPLPTFIVGSTVSLGDASGKVKSWVGSTLILEDFSGDFNQAGIRLSASGGYPNGEIDSATISDSAEALPESAFSEGDTVSQSIAGSTVSGTVSNWNHAAGILAVISEEPLLEGTSLDGSDVDGYAVKGVSVSELPLDDDILVASDYSLSDGSDGTIDQNGRIEALDLFVDDELVDISFLLAGDANKELINKIFDIASSRQDCLGVISPQKSHVVNQASPMELIKAYREDLNVGGLKDLKGSFMVMDDNWKYQFDRYNNLNRWVPCNGDTAGLMAETDIERAAWFSPGGRSLKNVIKLAWKSKKAERDILYPLGVNSITTFPGEGAVLYGDRTMLKRPSAFDRINVRRLFIVLRKTISRTARAFLFEQNTEFTRERFKSTVIPLLEEVQGRQGITDFLVVCDESNNTGQVIDQNRFIGDIYIKPTRSINFIELNFVAVRTDVEFSEVVGSI